MRIRTGGTSRYHSDSEAGLSTSSAALVPPGTPRTYHSTTDDEMPVPTHTQRIALKKTKVSMPTGAAASAPAAADGDSSGGSSGDNCGDNSGDNTIVQEPGQPSVVQTRINMENPKHGRIHSTDSGNSNSSSTSGNHTSSMSSSTPSVAPTTTSSPTGLEPRPGLHIVGGGADASGAMAGAGSRPPPNLGAIFARTFHFDSSRHVLLHCIPQKMSAADIHAMFSVYGDIESVTTQRLDKGVAIVSYFDTRDARTATLECNRTGLGVIASTCVPIAPICDWVLDFLGNNDQAQSFVKSHVSCCWQIKSITSTENNVIRIEFYDSRAASVAFYDLTQRNIGKVFYPPLSATCLRQSRGLVGYLTGSEGGDTTAPASPVPVDKPDKNKYVMQHSLVPQGITLSTPAQHDKQWPVMFERPMDRMSVSLRGGYQPHGWVPVPRSRHFSQDRSPTTPWADVMSPTPNSRDQATFGYGGGRFLSRRGSNPLGMGGKPSSRLSDARLHGRLRSNPPSPEHSPQGSRRRGGHGFSNHREVLPMNQISSDPQAVLRDGRSSVMIRNIPNKYTRKMILDEIDSYFGKTYDFFYLPIDFENKCNFGYAFINFINPATVVPFCAQFDGKAWKRFKSDKKCQMCYARLQGKEQFMSKFKDSTIWSMDPKFVPVLCHVSGPHAGEQDWETMQRLETSARNVVGRLNGTGDV
jgi:hypothetical protein